MRTFFLVMISSIFLSICVSAQDKNEKPEKSQERKWSHSTAAGIIVTSGNAETVTANGNHKSQLKGELDLFQFGLLAAYGVKETIDENGEESSDEFLMNVLFTMQYDRKISDRFFWLIGQKSELDKIANLEYRFNVGPGLGYKIIKKETMTWDFEIGGNYIREKYETIDAEDIMAARFAEKFNWKITESSTLWLNAEVLLNVEDSEDVRANGELGLEVKISDRWSIKSVLQNKYVNIVPDGTERNDITFITTLVFKY